MKVKNFLFVFTKCVLLSILILSSIFCDNKKTNAVSKRIVLHSNSINDYFIKKAEIELSNEVIVGAISSLDVYEKQKFLITDPISKKVFSFGPDGKYIKTLNPEICTPGFKLQASYARFNKKGKIYVINEFGTGYIFDKTGNCLGPMDNFFNVPSIDFLNSGEIVAYSNLGDGNYLKITSERGEKIDEFGIFPKQFKNSIERIMGGGIVIDEKDLVYQINVISPEIFVYKDKELIRKIANYAKNFRMIDSDLRNSKNPQDLISQYKTIVKENTTVSQLYLADQKILLVQFYHNKKYSLQLISTDGNKYLDHAIELNAPFIYAKDGFAYKVIQPDPINDYLPNPKLAVYKIKF